MTVSFAIDGDIAKKAEERAAERGETLNDVVTRILENYVSGTDA